MRRADATHSRSPGQRTRVSAASGEAPRPAGLPRRAHGPTAARQRAVRLLAPADVVLDGGRPWDPVIHDERLFRRVLLHGSLGLGEAYVEGWWDCEALDELFCRMLRAGVDHHLRSAGGLLHEVRAVMWNLQTRRRAGRVAEAHYDLGNDLFRSMLGKHSVYSCGYWRRARSLDEAQEAKLALVCDKLRLEPGMRVLDVGCGWGDAARFAAERYGAEVVGITISREQCDSARELCAGLPVRILLQDYRELEGRFDRIFSIGMFEHVGYKNYDRFMEEMQRHLAPDGLLLLHTIGRLSASHTIEPWMARYIFPNATLPSPAQIARAIESRFVLEDWHSFGTDYDRTLRSWYANFEAHWPDLASAYGEPFHRKWRYYLLSSAGTFRARRNQLWQLVLSPGGVVGGYRSSR